MQQLLVSSLKNSKIKSVFDQAHHWINFYLSEICNSMQNISLFHLFIFTYLFICSYVQPNLKSLTRLATPIFDHAQPNNLWLVFIFCESVSTCKKSVYSISSFFRHSGGKPEKYGPIIFFVFVLETKDRHSRGPQF